MTILIAAVGLLGLGAVAVADGWRPIAPRTPPADGDVLAIPTTGADQGADGSRSSGEPGLRCKVGDDVVIACSVATVPLGSGGSATSDSEQLFLLGDDGVRSVDPTTLEARWANPMSATSYASLAEDVVLVFREDRQWIALDRDTGDVRWETNAQAVFDIGTLEGLPQLLLAFDDDSTVRLDATDGREIWRRDGPPANFRAISGERLVIDNEDRTTVLDARSGEILREFPATIRYTIGERDNVLVQFDPRDGARDGSAVGGDGSVVAVDLETGEVRWEADAVQSVERVGDGVLLTDRDVVRMADLVTGEVLWSMPRTDDGFYPNIVEDRSGARLVVVDNQRTISYVDAESGDVVGTTCGTGPDVGVGFGLVDGRVLGTNADEEITAVDPTGKLETVTLIGAMPQELFLADPLLVRVGEVLHRIELPSRPAVADAANQPACDSGSTRTQVLATNVDHAIVEGDTIVTVRGTEVVGINIEDGTTRWSRDLRGRLNLVWTQDGYVALVPTTRPGVDASTGVIDVATGHTAWTASNTLVSPIGGSLAATSPHDGTIDVVDLSSGAPVREVRAGGEHQGLTATTNDLVITGTQRVTVIDRASGVGRTRAIPDVQQARMIDGKLVTTVGGTVAAGVAVRSDVDAPVTWSEDGGVDLLADGILVSRNGTTRRHEVATGEMRWEVEADAHRVVGPATSILDAPHLGDPAALITFQFTDGGMTAELRDLGTGEVQISWTGASLGDRFVVGTDFLVVVPGEGFGLDQRDAVVIRDRITGEIVATVPLTSRVQTPAAVSADPPLLLINGDLVLVEVPGVSVAAMLGQLRQ